MTLPFRSLPHQLEVSGIELPPHDKEQTSNSLVDPPHPLLLWMKSIQAFTHVVLTAGKLLPLK